MASPSQPTPAAFTRPLLSLFIISYLLNTGTGIGLWLGKTQPWRIAHGWSLPPFLIVLGVVWRFHIVRGWKIKKNILSGILTLLIFLILTISGWTIYYSGSDEIQRTAAAWHTWIGLGTTLLLFLHGLLGWRSRG